MQSLAALPLCLVVGSERSGTTIATRLLLETSAITGPPFETHFLDVAVPFLAAAPAPVYPRIVVEALLDEYERFWWLERTNFDRQAITSALDQMPAVSLAALFRLLVRSLTDQPGRVLLEKTPRHLWSWPVFVHAPWTKFVVVVRDPRAVAEATLRQSWAVNVGAAASQWAEEQREVRRLVAALGPSRAIVCRFEDVVKDPESFRISVCRFLGLDGAGTERSRQVDADGLFLDFEGTYKQDAVGPIDLARISAWQQRLTPPQVATVDAICEPIMRVYGYPVQGGRPDVARVKRFRTSVHAAAWAARKRYAALRTGDNGRFMQRAALAGLFRAVEAFWASREAVGGLRAQVATRRVSRAGRT